jgi:hypothetical protein
MTIGPLSFHLSSMIIGLGDKIYIVSLLKNYLVHGWGWNFFLICIFKCEKPRTKAQFEGLGEDSQQDAQ